MAKHKILLIDDGVIRHTIRDHLLSRNYEVVEADSCQAGLASFEAFHPDLIILDYSLPDGNALELLPKLKALNESVPCILLTVRIDRTRRRDDQSRCGTIPHKAGEDGRTPGHRPTHVGRLAHINQTCCR